MGRPFRVIIGPITFRGIMGRLLELIAEAKERDRQAPIDLREGFALVSASVQQCGELIANLCDIIGKLEARIEKLEADK